MGKEREGIPMGNLPDQRNSSWGNLESWSSEPVCLEHHTVLIQWANQLVITNSTSSLPLNSMVCDFSPATLRTNLLKFSSVFWEGSKWTFPFFFSCFLFLFQPQTTQTPLWSGWWLRTQNRKNSIQNERAKLIALFFLESKVIENSRAQVQKK